MASSLSLIGKVQRLRRQRLQARPTAQANQEWIESTEPVAQFSHEERRRWRRDPNAFAREVFGIFPWTRQSEILQACADDPRVAVRSGHKIGKSINIALLAYWFPVCFDGGRVVATAPTNHQIKNIVWREMRLLWRKAKRKPSPAPALLPSTGIQFDDGRQVLGFSSDEPENVAGISGENTLFLLDEGSGIPVEIFEAIEGNAAGGARRAMFGNPTQPNGEFFDAFHEKRDLYHTVHVSSLESPNVVERRIVVPGLATHEWVEEKRQEWFAPDGPVWQIRVEGNFATSSTNAVVGLGLVESAIERAEKMLAQRKFERADLLKRPGKLVVGVDVARYGDDDSVVAGARSGVAAVLEAKNGYDSKQVAGMVIAQVKSLRVPGDSVLINVDVIGYGAGVYDELVHQNRQGELGENVTIVGVNVAEHPDDEDKYPLLRDQLWFGARLWLADGGALLRDRMAEAELVAPRYKPDEKGRFKVERKDDIKKRLKRSPDRADALCLAFYAGSEVRIMDAGEDDGPPLSRWADMEGRGFG